MGPGPRRPAVGARSTVAGSLRAALLAACAISGCGLGPQEPARPAAALSAVDLAASERLGGHTLARHVGRTDDQLRERLRREPSIFVASTYPDQATAERVVAETLQRFSRRIQSWSARAGARPNLALDYTGEAAVPVGRSLRRGDARVRDCTDAVVVLRWHPRAAYYVLTSYPECRP
jgi:hypothetical protein